VKKHAKRSVNEHDEQLANGFERILIELRRKKHGAGEAKDRKCLEILQDRT
jgi:hypothetical protein